MRDPVTDFSYPESWVQACRNPELLADVERGLAILTSVGSVLKRGFSTGTTAAAACKAAVLSLAGPCRTVTITLPCGISVALPVQGDGGTATCRKDPGDYPGDVTAGLEFRAEASAAESGIELVAGEGIGRFVRDTPRYVKGSPAISPSPLACILRSLDEALQETGLAGVRVRLSIPAGAKTARLTLNPKVGIEGGISVLGTTGLVEPWDDHLGEAAVSRIAESPYPVLTTGRIGLRYARLLFPEQDVILVGSRLRESVEAVRGTGTLIGLPGLILKFIRPDILDGTGYQTVEEFSTDPAFPDKMQETLAGFREKFPQIRVMIIDRSGTIIGETS